jgi:tetratricopeptide (TPR) repeat protein
MAYQQIGRTDEAIALFERTLDDRQRLLRTNHPDTAETRRSLADAYNSAGRTADAAALFP